MISRKDQIRAITARLFRKKGYSATTMREIADAVGVKAASLYNHFGSKQEILHDLLMQMAYLYTKGMRDISESDMSVGDQLRALITLHIDLTIEYTDASAMIASEWTHLEEPARTSYIKLREDYERDFKEIIERGMSEGVIRQMDTEIALFSVLSTLRWLYSWYSRHRTCDADLLREQMTRVLLGGILAS